MRRIPAIIAFAAALVAVPLTIAATASPAAAATGSLTVTTLGRDGSKVASTVSVADVNGIKLFTVASGKKLSVPDGTYDVMVDIYDTNDNTDTLGAKVVKISGATTTTIDARQGKAMKISLDSDPGPGYAATYWADICGWDGSAMAGAWNGAGQVYVIPNASTTLQFAYLAIWRPTYSSSASYIVSDETHGVPSSVSAIYHVSSLANVSVTERSGPAAAPNTDLLIVPQGKFSNTDCQRQLLTEDYAAMPTPWTTTAHVSAGKWTMESDEFGQHGDESWAVGYWTKNATLTAGESLPWTFYRSSFGPAHNLPLTLSKTLDFDGGQMFGDPELSDQGLDANTSVKTSLSYGGTTLSTQGEEFFKKLTHTGWYTFTANATRTETEIAPPAGMLSPKSSVSFHFYDDLTSSVAPVFLTRFEPLGLNRFNQATPGSTTDVELKLDRTQQDPDAVLHTDSAKTVHAWMSADGGTTWTAVRVTHSGSSWTADISNPTSGTVSLRSTVTDAKGNSSTVTVYTAYRIA